MGMTVLILSTCLLADPEDPTKGFNTNTCKEVNLTYADENLTPMQCAMRAQPEIAKWVSEHPNWAVKKWKCDSREQSAHFNKQDI
jgi:hypothetical protein